MMIMETTQSHLYATDEERWQALVEKDPGAEGKFFIAVRTTGIYCRPGCASRRPNRENVSFFESAAAAQAAGYRPCKRCQPERSAERSEQAERIIQACALIEQAETCPTLAELAGAVGLSPFHFQRLFHKTVGITPRQYFAQKRAERVRERLSSGERVTDALYNAGYGSSGHFYGQAKPTLGMKPAAFRSGAPGTDIWYTVQPCYLGWALIAATQVGICTIEFGDRPEDLEASLKARFPGAIYQEEDPQFTAWVREALAYIEQPVDGLRLPLDIQGTTFQRKVWAALQEIPAGQRASYIEIARRIGQPTASRAVAQACGANRLAVVVPCHRVVRENGELGGYKWGIARKQQILAREERRE